MMMKAVAQMNIAYRNGGVTLTIMMPNIVALAVGRKCTRNVLNISKDDVKYVNAHVCGQRCQSH